jgi:hypothetical protein
MQFYNQERILEETRRRIGQFQQEAMQYRLQATGQSASQKKLQREPNLLRRKLGYLLLRWGYQLAREQA